MNSLQRRGTINLYSTINSLYMFIRTKHVYVCEKTNIDAILSHFNMILVTPQNVIYFYGFESTIKLIFGV